MNINKFIPIKPRTNYPQIDEAMLMSSDKEYDVDLGALPVDELNDAENSICNKIESSNKREYKRSYDLKAARRDRRGAQDKKF